MKASGAGGKIVMSKTSIGPNGFMAIFTDTEGNRVALPFYEINSVMHTFHHQITFGNWQKSAG